MERIYLDSKQLEHIRIGHRDIAKTPNLTLKSAIEQTTAVHYGHSGRYIFLSDHVTKAGHPMAVVVLRKDDGGKVITASWTDGEKPPLIWDAASGLYAHFDPDGDIMYLSRGDAGDAYSKMSRDRPEIWYRYSEERKAPIGVTIFDARDMRAKGVESMAKIVSDFLGVAPAQIADRILQAMAADERPA